MAPVERRRARRRRRYLDTLGFMMLDGLFVNHVTGSIILASAQPRRESTRLAGHLYPTNMVTGTMTVLGMDTGARRARLHSGGTERAAAIARARQYAMVVVGFAAGAVLAAAVTSRVHFWAAAVPLATIAVAARRELAARPLLAPGDAPPSHAEPTAPAAQK